MRGSLCPKFTFLEMVAQRSHKRDMTIQVGGLDGFSNAPMRFALPDLRQTAIGDFVGEGMPEFQI
jgi:hypothetical protein